MLRLFFRGVALATAGFVCTGSLTLFAADPVLLYETAGASNSVEYCLKNNTSALAAPYAITCFLVTTTAFAPAPSTTDAHWTAQLLDDVNFLWDSPMGGLGSGLPTWHQYTGLNVAQAFPHGTLKVNGYFADYTYDSGTGLVSAPQNPIVPTDPIRGGFFFNGASSSEFVAAGPTNWTQPYALTSVQTATGNATAGPPPTTPKFDLAGCVMTNTDSD